jgi:hypothetical protein
MPLFGILGLDGTVVTGLLSLAGCICMLLVCAAQMRALLAAMQHSGVKTYPWDMNSLSQSARSAHDTRYTSAPAREFAPPGARLALSRL